MECLRCGSLRIIKFVDAFGVPRVYCRSCRGSFPQEVFLHAQNWKDFVHDNPRALVRWRK